MTSTNPFFLLSSTAHCLLLLLLSASSALLLHSPPSSANGLSQNREFFDVSDLLPSPTCLPPKGLGRQKLEVVHQHGSCSPFRGRQHPPPHVQILDEDQARVKWLQRRIEAATAENLSNQVRGSESIVQLPTKAGGKSLGTGDYIVTVGFGTPRKDFPVGFDTGSDLTWIQCEPCTTCYPQKDPFYNPNKSTTYATYPCTSTKCFELDSHKCSAKSVCRYTVDYGDKSETVGNLGHDVLMLKADVIPGFTFGCGDTNVGFSGRTAGLIGLGRGSISLASQLSPNYGFVFSYCLPSKSNAMGYLTIGRAASTTANAQYTSMLPSKSSYFVNLKAIEVSRIQLAIQPAVFSPAGTVMDSGTVISRLPASAYAALRTAFKAGMTMYKPAPAFSLLDTCYDFTGMSTVRVPTVALVFDGGARLDLDFRGILYVVSVSQGCLAFAPKDNDGDVAIVGSVQQRTYGVIYDVENSRIGFASNSCP